jgi:hypothetical protein
VDRIIIALIVSLALLFATVTGVAKAASSSGDSDTTVTVGLVSKTSGLIPSVTLAWGSASETIVVKTNSAKGYRLTARAVRMTGGFGVSLADVKVELRKIYGTARCYAVGSTAGSTWRTDKYGDIYEIRVSVWQPIGAPVVTLAYNYEVIR